MSERVLVSGSREWTDRGPIRAHLEKLPRDSVVIHGGARGVDRLADDIARAQGFHVEVYHADWEAHGKRAGFLRTRRMFDEGHPTRVLAFSLDDSPGTGYAIEEARRRGVRTTVELAYTAPPAPLQLQVNL
jgi:hypothetical protein